MLIRTSRHPVDSRWLDLAIVFFARTGVGFQFIAVAALMAPLRQALSLGYGEVGILLGIFMLDPMIAGPEGWPVLRYATVRGLSRLAGTEPHA